MKHSNTWFALILILSASLLSAANGGDPRNAKQDNQAGAKAESEDTPSSQVTTTSQQANPNSPADHRQPETYNYYGNFNYVPPSIAAQGFWAEHASAIAGLSTIFVAIFTGALVVTSVKQWRAMQQQAETLDSTLSETAKAANAAKQSADGAKELIAIAARQAKAAEAQVTNLEKTLAATEKAANAAMKTADAALAASAAYLDITYLWLETEKEGSDVMDAGLGVVDPLLHWTLTNHGKSPAIVTELCWQKFFGLRLPNIPVYDNVSPLPRELIIGAEKEEKLSHKWSFLFGTYLTEQDMEPVRKMESRLQIYGYVRYRDVFDRRVIVGYAFRLNAKGNPSLVSDGEAAIYLYRRFE